MGRFGTSSQPGVRLEGTAAGWTPPCRDPAARRRVPDLGRTQRGAEPQKAALGDLGLRRSTENALERASEVCVCAGALLPPPSIPSREGLEPGAALHERRGPGPTRARFRLNC
jgi:hypothetical protein